MAGTDLFLEVYDHKFLAINAVQSGHDISQFARKLIQMAVEDNNLQDTFPPIGQILENTGIIPTKNSLTLAFILTTAPGGTYLVNKDKGYHLPDGTRYGPSGNLGKEIWVITPDFRDKWASLYTEFASLLKWPIIYHFPIGLPPIVMDSSKINFR